MKRLDPSLLRPGDIILTTTRQPTSKAIRIVTSSNISHAMIYVESHSVIDATAEGVQARNTQRLFLDDDCAVYGLRLNRVLTNVELKGIQDYVRSIVGTQYSLWEAVQAPLGRRNSASRRQFCSRLVAQAYAYADIKLVPDPNYCTPEDLRKSPLMHDLGEVTVAVSDEDVARWAMATDLPQMTRDATNAVLSGARQRDPSIQDFRDLDRHLVDCPEDDGFIYQLYRESGYLDLWRVECERNPWQYDLRLMHQFHSGGGDVAEYCRLTAHEEMVGHRFMINHVGYVIYAANTGLRTFAVLEHLYEILASLHQQRVGVARKWLQANGRTEELPPDALTWLVPNSAEWLEALAQWNPVQAEISRKIVQLAGSADACAICGDEPAANYRLIDEPPVGVSIYRLCEDCAAIRQESGERLTQVYLQP